MLAGCAGKGAPEGPDEAVAGVAGAVGAVLFELTFFVVLLRPRLVWLYLPVGAVHALENPGKIPLEGCQFLGKFARNFD